MAWQLNDKKSYAVYVMRDGKKDFFKFGVSTDLKTRCRSERAQLYHSWRDNDAWTATFLERSAVALAQRWYFPRYANDWFDIDEPSVKT